MEHKETDEITKFKLDLREIRHEGERWTDQGERWTDLDQDRVC